MTMINLFPESFSVARVATTFIEQGEHQQHHLPHSQQSEAQEQSCIASNVRDQAPRSVRICCFKNICHKCPIENVDSYSVIVVISCATCSNGAINTFTFQWAATVLFKSLETVHFAAYVRRNTISHIDVRASNRCVKCPLHTLAFTRNVCVKTVIQAKRM